MKKFLSLILVLSMALCFAACGETAPATQPTGNSAVPAESYSFQHNGVRIAMHADAAPILAALGEPISCTEETSCAFDGLDKTYYYGSIYLQTYPVGDKDYVFSAWFMDDGVATEEGIYIGCDQQTVEGAYGAECFNGTNAYIVDQGTGKLTVILTDGVVSSIQYDAVIE